MVEQVTSGIKISVETQFEGTFYRDYKLYYSFAYRVTITNQSEDMVQLDSRAWTILDALNTTEYVSGEGVIGKQPIITPGESHSYNSGCMLLSPIGAMKGHYNMTNFSTNKTFKVKIPIFKLNALYVLN